MNNKGKSIKDNEKCFLYMEIFQIFVYLLLSILEFAYSIKMYSYWSSVSNLYYYYVMNKRIVPSKYLSNLVIVNDSAIMCNDTYYNKALDNTYVKHEFININQLQNANPIDVTSKTLFNHPGNSTWKQNNSLVGLTYYDVDLSIVGNQTINMQTSYPLKTWKNYSFCARNLNFDINLDSFQVIDYNQQCKDVFGNYSVDCGSYRENTFRICVRKEYLTYSTLNIPFLNFDTNNTDKSVCPFNYIRLWSQINTDYNSSNQFSKYYNIYSVTTQLNNGPNKDTNLFVNIGNIKTTGAKNITEESFDKPFSLTSVSNTLTIGTPYGFYDNFNLMVDQYDWFNFYNETMFYSFYDNTTGINNTFTGFFIGDDLSSYYRVLNINTTNLDVFLGFFQFELISKDCYINVFQKNGRKDILGIVFNNRVKFVTESVGVLMCWALVSIFLSCFAQIYIRFYIIYRKLNNNLSKDDQDSELISKLVIKLLQAIIFVVKILAIIYNKTLFNSILNNLNLLILNNCFKKSTIAIMTLYFNFVQNLSNDNNIIMIYNICAFSGEFFILFTYFLIWQIERKGEFDRLKEEEEKKKEEEIIKRALKKEQ